MAEVNNPPALEMAMVEGTLRVHRKVASSGLYLAALLVFLLPFVSVSCGAQTVLTLSGIDLTFGRDLGSQFGTSAPLGITAGHLDAHLWVLLVPLALTAGLVVAWLEPTVEDRVIALVLAGVGAFGSFMMLVVLGNIAGVNGTIQTSCQNQAGCVNVAAAVQVNPDVGVWLEALLDMGMLALGILWYKRWLPATGPSNQAAEASESSPEHPTSS